MATAPRPWVTSIPPTVENTTHVIQRNQRHARPVIWQASTATLPPLRSPPGMEVLSNCNEHNIDDCHSFLEPYLSTTAGSPYYIGDKSFVFHASNTTRITCANFVAGSGSTVPHPAGTTPAAFTGSATGSSEPAAFTGAATQMIASGSLIACALAVAMSFLV